MGLAGKDSDDEFDGHDDDLNQQPQLPSAPIPTPPPPPPPSSVFRTVGIILLWYAISNTIILSTKWLFTNHFPFPLTVTMLTNIIAFLWARILSCHPKLMPKKPLTKQVLLEYVLPIGLCTALEIGCSNFALELLSVSFGTILKGATPVFTFVWGRIFGLEQFSWSTFTALLIIAFGIALASFGEGQEFQALGFGLQLFSTSLAGFRWAMTHRLLKGAGEDEKMSPLTALLYTSPATTISVIPFALALEAKSVWTDSKLTQESEPLLVASIITGIATLVFALIMSEYWLVNATSSLTLSVAGVFKELLTIGGGLFFFSEHVDLLNEVGFFTCQMGILTYVYLRYKRQRSSSADSAYAHVSEEEEAIITREDPYTDEGMELSAYTDDEGLAHRHPLHLEVDEKNAMPGLFADTHQID